MGLRGVDEKHFYVGARLIDLVWINHHSKTLINAANYHEMNRSLHWIRKLAERLAVGNERVGDETELRQRLATLGLEWIVAQDGSETT